MIEKLGQTLVSRAVNIEDSKGPCSSKVTGLREIFSNLIIVDSVLALRGLSSWLGAVMRFTRKSNSAGLNGLVKLSLAPFFG